MKSKRVLLVVCGATGLIHCGGQLLVGETGEGAAGSGARAGGTGLTGASAGKAASGASKTSGSGGTGNTSAGHAGKGAVAAGATQGGSAGATHGGSGPVIVGDAGRVGDVGQGGEPGQSGNAGQSGSAGSGGNAGEPQTPCDCGSTPALRPIACGADGYGAKVSDDGSTVLYQSYFNSSVNHGSALWTVDQGTVYEGHRLMEGLSGDGRAALFTTDSGVSVLRAMSGHETSLPPSVGGEYLSRDGLTVVGVVATSTAETTVTWTAAGGVVTPDSQDQQQGVSVTLFALNSDASVLAGRVRNGSSVVPFVWNAGVTHEIMAANQASGWVNAVSEDGSVAAGITTTGETGNSPHSFLYTLFRWSVATDSMTNLGPCRSVDDQGTCDDALFVSSDGGVLAGSVAIASGSTLGQAFRWTSAGLVNLDGYGTVRGMSADGNVIVGNVIDFDTGAVTAPFVWQAGSGQQNLSDQLGSAGADLGGWSLGDVITVSRDGRVVLGSATCHGVPALYRADLSAPTE
jgi:hypothetical protein